MIEKGYGDVTFGSEGIRPEEFFERKKGVDWKGVRAEKGTGGGGSSFYRGIWRRQIGMKKREEFRERVRVETWRKKGRVVKFARSMGEETVSPSHDATVLKEMLVAARRWKKFIVKK